MDSNGNGRRDSFKTADPYGIDPSSSDERVEDAILTARLQQDEDLRMGSTTSAEERADDAILTARLQQDRDLRRGSIVSAISSPPPGSSTPMATNEPSAMGSQDYISEGGIEVIEIEDSNDSVHADNLNQITQEDINDLVEPPISSQVPDQPANPNLPTQNETTNLVELPASSQNPPQSSKKVDPQGSLPGTKRPSQLRATAYPRRPSRTLETASAKEISKALTTILRHQAQERGLGVSKGGYVRIDDILNLPEFNTPNTCKQKVINIIQAYPKRYTLTHDWKSVKTHQGHSMGGIDIEDDLARVRSPTNAHHLTSASRWEIIKREGLNKLDRTHIHFSPHVDTERAWKKDTFINIQLNTALMIRHGIPLFVNDNGTILSPGENGVIGPRYFFKVWHVATHETIYDGTYNVSAKSKIAPPSLPRDQPASSGTQDDQQTPKDSPGPHTRPPPVKRPSQAQSIKSNSIQSRPSKCSQITIKSGMTAKSTPGVKAKPLQGKQPGQHYRPALTPRADIKVTATATDPDPKTKGKGQNPKHNQPQPHPTKPKGAKPQKGSGKPQAPAGNDTLEEEISLSDTEDDGQNQEFLKELAQSSHAEDDKENILPTNAPTTPKAGRPASVKQEEAQVHTAKTPSSKHQKKRWNRQANKVKREEAAKRAPTTPKAIPVHQQAASSADPMPPSNPYQGFNQPPHPPHPPHTTKGHSKSNYKGKKGSQN